MPTTACLGALALELRPGAHAAHAVVETAAAAKLAEGIGHDLARLAPAATACALGVLAAHYDPVELLRPGWPVHAALEALVQRAPVDPAGADDGQGRILAFGAHRGAWPDAVPAPAAEHARGAMRLLPFLLRGPADAMQGLAQELEEVLLERGMAGATTALCAQEIFGAPIEHARYLTLHDLCALMAMQYEHAGLGPLWPLIEAALLAPQEEVWLDAPPEPRAQSSGGRVWIETIEADAWRAGGYAPVSAGEDPVRLARAFEHFQARQRQFAAVLEAHGIEVGFDRGAAGHATHGTMIS